MRPLRIALVQMESRVGDKEANLRKTASFAEAAGRNDADIVCFPEMSVSGYSGHAALAEPVPGPSAEAISRMASENGIVISAGLSETSPTGKPFVSQIIVGPDGLIGVHRKAHLGSTEVYFSPGSELRTFDIPKARLGVLLCWESRVPEAALELAMQGAEIVLMPFASPAKERRASWMRILPARAADGGMFVAACNQRGRFSGGAMVIGPRGEVVAEDFGDADSMLLADLDPSGLDRLRSGRGRMGDAFALASRRPELYASLRE